MSQYQLLITVASLGELQSIAEHLEKLQGGRASSAALTGNITPSPVVQIGSTDVEDEDSDESPANIFGQTDPAAVFAPNVVATATPLIPVQPASSAVSQTAVGVELDPRGFPWDGRIHASTRTRLAKDQTWKLQRGIASSTVAAVEAELRSQGFGNPDSSQPAAPIAAVHVVAPALPGLPNAPVLPAVVKPTGPTSESITERFTRGLQAQLIDATWILQVLAAYGIANLQALSGSPDKFVAINDYLNGVRDSAPVYKDL